MRLVLIEWLDATGGTRAGWKPVADMKRDLPHKCRSVGWIIHEDDDRVVIVPHMTGDGDGDGELTIPRDWQQSVLELTEKPQRRKRK
jgi:hypothetical protein